MKNSIVITDSERFEEIINSLETSINKLKGISTNENKNKELINSTDIWTGTAQKAMYKKCSTLVESFGQIEYSLDIYVRFLKKTLEDYKLVEKEISNNIDQVANNLDVNS